MRDTYGIITLSTNGTSDFTLCNGYYDVPDVDQIPDIRDDYAWMIDLYSDDDQDFV